MIHHIVFLSFPNSVDQTQLANVIVGLGDPKGLINGFTAFLCGGASGIKVYDINTGEAP